jgi:hypothetical protein
MACARLIGSVKRLLRFPRAKLLIVGVTHQHQWRESTTPSQLERDQRKQFIESISGFINTFRPTIILDEVPDTDNEALLNTLPSRPISVDIPSHRKLERKFNVERSMHFLCPYIDSIRERFWRWCIHQITKKFWNARVLIFIGAKHLGPIGYKSITFPDLMRKAGYSVETVNLYDGNEWDNSWVQDWKHPATPVNWEHKSQCCVRSGTYQRDDRRCSQKIYWKERLAAGEPRSGKPEPPTVS